VEIGRIPVTTRENQRKLARRERVRRHELKKEDDGGSSERWRTPPATLSCRNGGDDGFEADEKSYIILQIH